VVKNEIRNLIYAGIISLGVTGIVASSKAFIDVERLKTRVDSMLHLIQDTREDVKDIKKYLLNRRGNR
jgi:hypothetical protein